MPKTKPHPQHNSILVSACLAGINCTFRGTNNLHDGVKKLFDDKIAAGLCPEIFGGMGVPRENMEIVGGDGLDVLEGRARVISSSGKDMTKQVVDGAHSVLNIVKNRGIKKAILKSNSPTCGSGHIYDGTFSKKLRKGDGVLAALLKKNGISVITEEEV